MRLRGQLRKEAALLARDPVGIATALMAPPAILWVFSRISLGEVHFGSAFRETSPVALVLCLGIWLSGLTSASSALYRERLAGTLERLRATPFSPEALLASKALVLGALGVAQAGLAWLAARLLVADELGGADRPEALAGLALLALAAVAAGLLLAALLPSPTQVASCATFLTLAVISLSGFFKPVDQMGRIGPVARSLPFTLAYRSTRTFVDGSAPGPGLYAGLVFGLAVLLAGASVALRLAAKAKPRA
jgi:ABC-type multidrug transport system permease subunit